MEKLSSIGQFEWLRNKILSKTSKDKSVVHVCMTGCRAYGAAGVLESLKDEVKSQKLADQVDSVRPGLDRWDFRFCLCGIRCHVGLSAVS